MHSIAISEQALLFLGSFKIQDGHHCHNIYMCNYGFINCCGLIKLNLLILNVKTFHLLFVHVLIIKLQFIPVGTPFKTIFDRVAHTT